MLKGMSMRLEVTEGEGGVHHDLTKTREAENMKSAEMQFVSSMTGRVDTFTASSVPVTYESSYDARSVKLLIEQSKEAARQRGIAKAKEEQNHILASIIKRVHREAQADGHLQLIDIFRWHVIVKTLQEKKI